MNLLVSLTGLITGVIEALIVRIWLQPIQLSLLIIAAAFLGYWITYLIIFINPNIFHPIFKAIWSFLWQPLGFGAPSGGNAAVLALLPLTVFLIQLVGSIIGGLLGL